MRPSDKAIKRQAELDSQSQGPTRIETVTLGGAKPAPRRPGGIKNNLKTINLRRTGRRV